jgi:NADH:ubiquinone oxidoreductase subunit F (NADH-binding)
LGDPPVLGGPARHGRLLLHDAVWPLGEGSPDAASGPGAQGHAAPPMAAQDLVEHRADVGLVPAADLEILLAGLKRSGLTGHGGGHVPVALKWRATMRGTGRLTVVANGAESEPLSAKDATLLQQRPHLVLDGLALTAEALGAERAVIWLHGSDVGTRRVVERAVSERWAAQWASGSAAGVPIEVVSGPSHYLAGEASAIVQGLGGGPALPTARRPRSPDAPRTLVHNVETLARLALLARGLPAVGTVLLTIVGPSGRSVREVPRGVRFADVLWSAGHAAPAGVLLGGFGGMWASWSDVADIPVDAGALRVAGLELGAGIVAPLAAGACPVAETAAIVEYLAGMSARQCGPCLFGLPAVAGGVRRLMDGTAGRAVRRRLVDDLGAVAGRGACHHPDGAVRLTGSLLTVWAEHVELHVRGGRCSCARVLPVPAVSS